MERPRWLLAMVLICSFTAFCEARELKVFQRDGTHIYNETLAKILVEYASAVYWSDLTALFTWTCSRCNDMIEDFEMIELIVDVQNCLQAFVGVDHDLNSIVIAFRGTQEHSIQNWIEDLFWKQLDLKYPNMPDAMVHRGFYSAYHNTTLRPSIQNAVKRIWEVYGDLRIIVTGHSMGGAMASFCAIDFAVNHRIHEVQLMTFGQPRIGNAAFASYFSKHVPHTVRVTHGNDIVPHLPPYFPYFPQKTYHHFPTEVWLHNIGLESLVYMIETICDSSGEDPSCSRSVSGNSLSDHLMYYGIELEAESSASSCRIVMDSSVMKYTTDLAGNIAISRPPTASSFLEATTQADTSSSSF